VAVVLTEGAANWSRRLPCTLGAQSGSGVQNYDFWKETGGEETAGWNGILTPFDWRKVK